MARARCRTSLLYCTRRNGPSMMEPRFRSSIRAGSACGCRLKRQPGRGADVRPCPASLMSAVDVRSLLIRSSTEIGRRSYRLWRYSNQLLRHSHGRAHCRFRSCACVLSNADVHGRLRIVLVREVQDAGVGHPGARVGPLAGQRAVREDRSAVRLGHLSV